VNGETLIFAQAAPEISKSDHTILVSALSSGVKVNGQALDGTVVLPHGSEINIKGRRYRVDLQLSERLSAPAQIQAVWETDIGPARRENQDAIGIYHGDNNVYLFAVADGVGSGYSGDKMSAYTINYLLSAINLNHHKAIPWEEVLYQAIHNANTEIRNFLLNLQQHGGTTLTALVIEEWTATISHLGDSRLYLLRNKMLKQISQDHSEEIASDDISTLDKVETQFVLSKAIGKTNQVEPDLMTLKLQPDDRLLLCTDGITGRIADDELSQLLSDAPIINLARQLVQLSNQRNNTDNASAIVIDILDHQTRDMTWETKAQPRVYIGDSTHMIELKKIEKSAANKQVREETSSDDDENGLGCSCLVLSFLIGCLILAILWGSGFLYESLGLDVLSQNQVQESSQTPEIANTVTLIPRPTRNASEILTSPTVAALLTTEALSSSPSALTEQETVTVIPTSTGSEQISFEIVSATALMQLEITSTVRPINPPR
jgi:protein phosphatase